MTSFSRFQERNKKRTVANSKLNTNYIFKGYPSIEITGSTDEKIQASVVNKQEKDYAYIFTQLDDKLSIGSTWAAKNLLLLVTEEITIIKDVNWHKYHALLCNVQVDNQWGYFKGPEKSFLDVALEKETVWESPQKPILVLPVKEDKKLLDFRDKIKIGNRAWLVQEYDEISTPGLVYYSLKPTTMSKQSDIQTRGVQSVIEKFEEPEVKIVEKPQITNSGINISANMPITLKTQDGYFKTNNKNIKIQKRTATEIVFSIPFGIQEVVVEIKEKGDIIEKIYRVV